ncbi:DUF3883 domain-containing protein [Streptomyces sp. NBC_00102]|uniref:protein NO VEIN domain-containing protein n=1 Tax=Streptomyces sp. NBC_00102 TaxID=2975652 RepID=UPI002254EAD4|nr:DUF3883 domain-containing protein [Streptomyces sp. NBC_00102]MCX5397271.1 DUF3883 domain-containing protein [Streptomyces sp. NBC_00102]
MPYQLGEGTRRAATRWLTHLRRADIPRLRTMFSHHPAYADLTPAQYAEALDWLKKTGMVSPDGQPAVHLTDSVPGPLGRGLRHVLWEPASEERNRQTGDEGERSLIALLRLSGAKQVVRVSAVSDAYGYDIDAISREGRSLHVEVKATTNPTCLVVHLTHHESDVMRADQDWIMGSVLVSASGSALSVATVSRTWLCSVLPADLSPAARWESVRLTVPGHALTPGLVADDARLIIPAVEPASRYVWGMTDPAPSHAGLA